MRWSFPHLPTLWQVSSAHIFFGFQNPFPVMTLASFCHDTYPSVMTTPRRTVRVPDPLWDRATQAAKVEGKTVTEVVLQGLTRFADRVLVDGTPPPSLPPATSAVPKVTKQTPASRCPMLRGTHRVGGTYVCKDCGKSPAEHL